jgi:hypothetical protein
MTVYLEGGWGGSDIFLMTWSLMSSTFMVAYLLGVMRGRTPLWSDR